MKLVAAGGLMPATVAEAITMLRPWGVDVVSGVESAPGRKDPAKVRAFIDRARAVESALSARALGS
jgi:phosphoribosylanthranilate isomerase